ncbi:radical SAM/SPASM domain-containing protein [Paenibacillus polymyxa]|uniref:radical SAM/SPASM domain-containing protein n=1 Tax=Paenibacillus polymyxa TaxID=1406 RepID=UPI00040836BC|nr:radical SAM protein [Paenibacillus polymyxa]
MKLKPSNYNLLINDKDEDYYLNTYTGSTLRLTKRASKDLLYIINKIEKYDDIGLEFQLIVELLLEHGFVLPYESDELTLVFNTFNERRKNKSALSLLITPTLKCNMKCFYCYQDRNNQSNLNKHDISSIVSFAAEKLEQSNRLRVTWFGGEPLFDKGFLFECSNALIELAKNRYIDYSATIVSNAYLLDTETLLNLVKHKVKNIQVTLDGSQVFHDKVRRHLNVATNKREASFEKIINNINLASNYLDITVRVNVSIINMTSIENLINELAKANLQSKIKNIYFHPIYNYNTINSNSNYKPTEGTHLTIQQFAKLEVEWLRQAYNKGFKINFPLKSGCSALQENSFIIESNGEVKKCNNDIGKSGTAFTTIYTTELISKFNIDNWKNYHPETITECRNCMFLPVCFSNCPHRNMNSAERKPDKCPSFKYNWREVLPFVLNQMSKD